MKELLNATENHGSVEVAVIPFRECHGYLEILMITSRGKKNWIFPKGKIKFEQSLKNAVTEKALEEAGVEGCVSDSVIGTYQSTKRGRSCLTYVFVMEIDTVAERWEQSDRTREWVTLDTAEARIDKEQLKRLVGSLPNFLKAAKLRQLIVTLPVFNRLTRN